MKKQTVLSRLINLLILVMFLFGIGLLLYPTVGQLINKHHQSTVIEGYDGTSEKLSEETRQALLSEAYAYNNSLVGRGLGRFTPSQQEHISYFNTLNIGNDGVIGYLSIPKIGEEMPIYHGTSDAVLQDGAGHVEGSSFPVGGENTHCVLAAHSGLAANKLFTDLKKLAIGDFFEITVLNQKIYYQVDQILVVLPEDTEPLGITEGEDYCTLLTCTPYGVNTHRLLVRGKRITEPVSSALGVTIAIPILWIYLLIVFLTACILKKAKNKTKNVNNRKPVGTV